MTGYRVAAYHYKQGHGWLGTGQAFVTSKDEAHEFPYKWNAINKASALNAKAADTGTWYELDREEET